MSRDLGTLYHHAAANGLDFTKRTVEKAIELLNQVDQQQSSKIVQNSDQSTEQSTTSEKQLTTPI